MKRETIEGREKEHVLASLQKLHGVDDGVASVYAEGHEDMGGGVE